ncbi:Alg9-like mannosyltransferase family-domain-containing protein [Lipomyces arxii]|uniref:Alg9-like mannosyltransferase family-domain-containing protein n=1 Tax=Lipomyces arxii TaxID=56418 RepID=UPI0034CE996E
MLNWRLRYLVFLCIRLYFTLSPSYIHPDEHFQGPEVLAGEIFGWNAVKTWEFTAEAPIRSILPLWLAYGIPMTTLRWLYGMDINPMLTYYCLRLFFFLVSFCLEDWALQELGNTSKAKTHYLLVVASSYVTWTYQTHTFSNSVETILVAWSLVLIKRISFRNFGNSNHALSCSLLGCIAAIGVFNRITFPAFLILPGWYLIPHFSKHPSSLFFVLAAGFATAALTVYIDTSFYESPTPVFTPLNNFLYNFRPENLAKHGLHARYTHVLINLPILLGPYLLLIRPQMSLPFLSAVSGTAVLSLFQHQEARFLLASVPLFLTATSLPRSLMVTKTRKYIVIAAFVSFNVILGVLFGVLHQGGVIPAQSVYISQHAAVAQDVIWWKTYSPPNWLLGSHRVDFFHRGGVDDVDAVSELVTQAIQNTTVNRNMRVWDMMGSDYRVVSTLLTALEATQHDPELMTPKDIYLVAPLASSNLYRFIDDSAYPFTLHLEWTYARHINLDDLGVDHDEALYYKRRIPAAMGNNNQALELSWWEKKKLIVSQNRPGIGVWRVVARD